MKHSIILISLAFIASSCSSFSGGMSKKVMNASTHTSLSNLIESYIDDAGQYTKKSKIYLNDASTDEVKQYFHAGYASLERTTYYDDDYNGGGALLMGDYDGTFESINSGYATDSTGNKLNHFRSNSTTYYSTIFDTQNVDYSIKNTTCNEYFDVLSGLASQVASGLNTDWTLSNGVYTHNVPATITIGQDGNYNDILLKKFQYFAAPMLLQSAGETASNYLTFSSIKVEEKTNYLSIGLYLSDADEGKVSTIKSNGEVLLSEAKVYKGWLYRGTLNDNPIDIVDVKKDTNNLAEFHLNLSEGDVLSIKDSSSNMHFHTSDVAYTETYTAGETGEYVFYYNSSHQVWSVAPLPYYIRGTMNGWDVSNSYRLKSSSDSNNIGEFLNLELDTNAKFQIANSDWSIQYGYWLNDEVNIGGGAYDRFTYDNSDIVCSDSGIYNLYLATSGKIYIELVEDTVDEIEITSDTLEVEQVANLGDDFMKGMDVSSLISMENSGVSYKGFDGNTQDLLATLKQAGFNYIRVRIWNDPYDSNGNGYGGGNCDLDKAIQIGKRATRYGMKLLIDFHYSDFWTDPTHYQVPKAWASISDSEKVNALYSYTYNSLNELNNEGVDVGMVQIGNEINPGIAGAAEGTETYYNLLKKGSQAVREVYPNALVAVHYTNPEKSYFSDYATKLYNNNVDYDVFGTSYYPHYHGTIENLTSKLSSIASTYNKKVAVLETSSPFTLDDSDGEGNNYSQDALDKGKATKVYEESVQGQANAVRDITNAMVNGVGNNKGIGVCYWEGAWISVGSQYWSENESTWNTYGSGWKTCYANSYNSSAYTAYAGGSSVDNQAFFDSEGNPLESLKVWALMKTGNTPSGEVSNTVQVTFKVYADIESGYSIYVTGDFTNWADDNTWKSYKLTYDSTLGAWVGTFEFEKGTSITWKPVKAETNSPSKAIWPKDDNDTFTASSDVTREYTIGEFW